MLTQVKMISARDLQALETEVNKWLKKNHRRMDGVQGVYQSESGTGWTITIVYTIQLPRLD
jgi:hypothetical protein